MITSNKQNIKVKNKVQKVIILFFALCFLSQTICHAFTKKPKIYTPKDEYKHQQKVLRREEIQKYKRSLLPESGYMTREEYEQRTVDIPNSQKTVPEYKQPKDIKMKYIPQPIYKLARYNNPPGSVELHIGRVLNFDRQFVCPGITSPNKDILVYPLLYYYATNQCTCADLFIIPLDKTLPDVQRIQQANIIKRVQIPILSTDKDISVKYIFRSLTPVDFSTDGSKLLVKEKTGDINDGIWQTNLWIYDFNKKSAKKIPEIREAIKFYWANKNELILDEKRWDIYPLGFDANNPERIVVSAYGYTGKMPVFLGVWSIDCNGERSMLVSLFKDNAQISMNGYKLIKEGVIDPALVYNNEKRETKIAKKAKKAEKKANKAEKKHKKQELHKKLKEMKKEEKRVLHNFNAYQKNPSKSQD